jgi:HlyD family secretion protein
MTKSAAKSGGTSRRFAGVVTITALVLSGCTAPSTAVTTTGTVNDLVQSVSMPSLSTPAVNLDAGFATSSTQTNSNSNSSQSSSSAATTYSLGSTQQLAQANVTEGQHVQAGQVIATIDDAQVKAQVAATKADAAVSASQVGLLSSAIDDTYTRAADVADAKATVRAAIAKLTKAQTALAQTQTTLSTTRADLVTKLAQAQALLANYPPTPPSGVPSKIQLQASIVALQAAIAKVDAGLAKIATTKPTLSSGLTKARGGLAQLDSASAKISDARAQLRRLRTLAVAVADIAKTAILTAEVQLQLTSITAPASGTVVKVAAVGDRLAAGATVAQIRQTGPAKVTSWLAPSQVAKVCLGASATITGDWMSPGQSAAATLTQISPTAEYPPSSVATDETHLTRAVKVEFTTQAELPAGVGVDVSISGCQTGTNPAGTGISSASSSQTAQPEQTGESHG